MCTVAVSSLGKSSRGEAFYPVDVTKGELPRGVNMSGALHDMHAVDDAGNLYVGGDAMLRILDEYPSWRWLARFVRIPGIRHLFYGVYRLVATHRRRFNSIVK